MKGMIVIVLLLVIALWLYLCSKYAGNMTAFIKRLWNNILHGRD